jgi:hypothetical protein
LASGLELAVSKLRAGVGSDEGTTCDTLREILHASPNHVKKALPSEFVTALASP